MVVPQVRGVLVIKTDAGFTETHPLWGMYSALRAQLAEIHVVILTSHHVSKRDRMIKPDEHTFWYTFQNNGLLFSIFHIWKVLKFHLRWRRVYRPDFVLSVEPGAVTTLAWFLSWRMQRPLFTHASIQDTESTGYLMRRWVLGRARGIFVPGDHTADVLARAFGIDRDKFSILAPSVDLPALKIIKERYNFEKEHPAFNVFLSSCAHTAATLHRVIDVHKHVRLQFPRCGLVLIVDEALYKKARRIARRHIGVFVYKKDEQYVSMIKGTSVYIALSLEQEVDLMMIAAFGVNMPVVAGAYGIAKELFPGSPYEQFLCQSSDVRGIVAAVVILLKDQYLRNQYGLNNPALSGKIAFSSNVDAAKVVMDTVIPIINPPEVHSAALPGTQYRYTDITPK